MKKFLLACVIIASVSVSFSACNSSEAKTAVYQCPMKCEGEAVTYDSAGKCPVCGMELAELSK